MGPLPGRQALSPRNWFAVVLMTGLIAGALGPETAAGNTGGMRARAYPVGIDTFEPTLGATANGDLYFSTTPDTLAIGWKASIAKSTDGGKRWEDVGPRVGGQTMPPETNDPYIYVDPATGRVFTFHMSPILTCSIMSFSDDGATTWTSNPRGCSPTVIWDHQTIVAAKPRGTPTFGYPNILHQCVNAVYAAMCARSLDGGLTWGPSVMAYPNTDVNQLCGAQHGHLTAGPDGTVYLPTSKCATRPMVYISRDDGLTWEQSVIADIDTPFVDPTVSVDARNNLYAAFIDEAGWLYYAVSRNGGKKWSDPVQVAKGYTTNMPVIVSDAPGKAVIAYPATGDLPKGYDTKGYLDGDPRELLTKVSWGANLTVTTNGLSKNPRFRTIVATGKDPIGRGRVCVRGTRCRFLVDFIEAVIGPDGRPYASFADGCVDACATDPMAPHLDMGTGLLVKLDSGPRLCARTCWRYKPSAASSMQLLQALGFASTVGRNAGREHALERLTPELRDLRQRAIRSRLDAVGGRLR